MNREKLKQELEKKYKSLKTYEEKLICVYEIIMQSQKYYLDYVGKSRIVNLDELLDKIKTVNSDSEFIDFLEDELISKLDAGHLLLKPNEEIINYELLPKEIIEQKREKDLESNTRFEIKDGVAVITIPSFSRRHFVKESEQEVYKDIERYLKESEVEDIIIDIRGNGGGTDEYFKMLLQILSNRDLTFNNMFRNLFTNHNENHSYVIKGNKNNRNYNIYLLVDNKVFSSAEAFARCLKDNNFATLIGEPTRGEGCGLTPISIVLSNELYNGKNKKDFISLHGINMTFPIEAPINERGEIDYEHFYNTKPDITCLSSEAMEVALGIIKENKNINNF